MYVHIEIEGKKEYKSQVLFDVGRNSVAGRDRPCVGRGSSIQGILDFLPFKNITRKLSISNGRNEKFFFFSFIFGFFFLTFFQFIIL